MGRGRGRDGVVDAVLAAVMHDQRANEHGEEDGGDHGLFLAGEGERTREFNEAVAKGRTFLPLAHS